MKKAGILFLAGVFVVLWACAGIAMASVKIQDEHARSEKPHVNSAFMFNAAVKADGTLWTWGYDQRAAQLGFNIFRPRQIGTDNNWLTVSAGGDLEGGQIAAIKMDGTLWTWAWPLHWEHLERRGRLGNKPISNVPLQVGKDRDWIAVSVGGDHIAALKRDGTLWTWGNNQHGQLGNGTTTSRNAPIRVGKDRDWSAVSTGAYHTAALKTDGTLWTWGWNQLGQLGIGTGGDIRATRSYADELRPVKVGEDRWMAVFAGPVQTAAIKKDGTLWIWGMHGITAQGVDRIQVRPLRINRDTDWTSISLGIDHAAALKTDGTLWVWGHNGFGKLGIGEDFVPGRSFGRGLPTQVGKDRDWVSVSVGTDHTSAFKADGTLWTWGSNLHGQLGDETLSFRNAPALVTMTTEFIANTKISTPITIKVYPRQRANAVSAVPGGELLPFIESGRTLVPLRFLSEQLGFVVHFDKDQKEVVLSKGTLTVRLRIGEKSALVFQEGVVSKTIDLDLPAIMIHGRTIVPLRFVSEVSGAAVSRTDIGNVIIRKHN